MIKHQFLSYRLLWRMGQNVTMKQWKSYMCYCLRHIKPLHHRYTAGQGRLTGAADILCLFKAFCSPPGKPWRRRSCKTPWVVCILHPVLRFCTWKSLWTMGKWSRPSGTSWEIFQALSTHQQPITWNKTCKVHLKCGPWKVCKNHPFADSPLITNEWASVPLALLFMLVDSVSLPE